MKYKKKREFEISELTQLLSKKMAWGDGYTSVQILYFFRTHWSEMHQAQISEMYFEKGVLKMKIASPLFKNDLKLRKQQLLSQINTYLQEAKVEALDIY